MNRLKYLIYLSFVVLACGCGRQQPGALPAAVPGQQQRPAVEQEAAAGKAAANVTLEKTVTNSIGMKLSLVPAGQFLMGSAAAKEDDHADEKPQHRVRITKPFYLGIYEVTQGEYQQVLGANPSFFSSVGSGKSIVAEHDSSRFPAEQLSWHDAVKFCRRLSALPVEKRARRVYRLPTEAQWEYACSAGTDTLFHFGDSLTPTQANFNGKYPYGDAAKGPFRKRTTRAGSFPPNGFGLYDMHGNVWEWCADWYAADYYKSSPVDDPQGPASGSSRVIRSGGWYSDARDCRSGFRNAELPTGVFYVLGFRVVMTFSDSAGDAATEDLASTDAPSPALATVRPVSPVTTGPEAMAGGEDWPLWRGPRGDGSWKGPQLPEKWPTDGLRCSWRLSVGGGYAGVVASKGRVYTMDRQIDPTEVERVLAMDAATGKPLWTHQYAVKYDDMQYGNGPRASPTLSDGRLYTLGARGHLYCFDAAGGKIVWSKDLVGEHKARVPTWGLAASPVVYEDLIIVHAAGEPAGCIIAFDRQTGEEAWRSVPDPAGYATPILIQHQGGAQLVCWTPTNIRGVDPGTGKVLWTVPLVVTYGTSIATPIFHEDIVLVSNYWEGSTAIRLGSTLTEAAIVWEDRRNLRALMSQPLYRDGHGYLLDKRHGLTCFELKTGKKLWDDDNRMTSKGRNPQATMVWIGQEDRAIILNSDGELILARLSPTGYEEQSRTKIIGTTWAHPAYAGGRVYARSDSELVCFSLLEGGKAEGESTGK